MLRSTLFAIGAGISLTAAVAAGLNSPAAARTPPAQAVIVHHFLPGSTVTVTPGPGGAAGELTIGLPASATPPGRTRLQQEFTCNELGWRAAVASGLVTRTTPIARFQVKIATGAVPAESQDALHGGLTGTEIVARDGKLDTLDPSVAMRQLQSNVAVLERAMPAGSVTEARPVLIGSGAQTDQFALEVAIAVDRAASLTGHYGDVLQGLQTGLTGDLSSTAVEGLSITVHAADGEPVVGSWESTRAGGGTVQFADPGAEPDALRVTTTFPDLTGGPSTRIGVTGRPGTSGKAADSDAVAAPRNPVMGSKDDYPPVHRTSSSTHSAWFLSAAIAAALAAVTIALAGRHRRRGAD